jgi:ActR/RegA family two-component response regulator
LKKIETLDKKPKILILTGSSKVEQTLREKNLPSYDILLKPVDFNGVYSAFKKLTGSF